MLKVHRTICLFFHPGNVNITTGLADNKRIVYTHLFYVLGDEQYVDTAEANLCQAQKQVDDWPVHRDG